MSQEILEITTIFVSLFSHKADTFGGSRHLVTSRYQYFCLAGTTGLQLAEAFGSCPGASWNAESRGSFTA
jgi:hypothetical protein